MWDHKLSVCALSNYRLDSSLSNKHTMQTSLIVVNVLQFNIFQYNQWFSDRKKSPCNLICNLFEPEVCFEGNFSLRSYHRLYILRHEKLPFCQSASVCQYDLTILPLLVVLFIVRLQSGVKVTWWLVISDIIMNCL